MEVTAKVLFVNGYDGAADVRVRIERSAVRKRERRIVGSLLMDRAVVKEACGDVWVLGT